MTSRALRWPVLLALTLALVGLSDLAAAETRRARVSIKGPGREPVAEAIEGVLSDRDYVVVAGKSKKKVDLTVEAKLTGSGRKAKARITLRDGNGEKLVTVSAAAKKKGLAPEAARALGKALDQVGGDGEAVAAGEDAEAEGDKAEKPADKAAAGKKPPAGKKQFPARKQVAAAEPTPEPAPPPAAEEPEPAPPAAEPDPAPEVRAVAAPAEGAAPLGPALSLAVGPELLTRRMAYRDDLFEALREYELDGAIALGGSVEWYPLAGRSGALAGLGVAGRLSRANAFQSYDVEGREFENKAGEFAVGLRYRMPLVGLLVTGLLDYGRQHFEIESADVMDPGVPNVSYRYARIGAGATLNLGARLAGYGVVAYRQVHGLGELVSEAYFPNASARGIDVEAGASFALFSGLDLRGGLAYERYGLALEPEPGDPRVAGGMTDTYLRFFVWLGYRR